MYIINRCTPRLSFAGAVPLWRLLYWFGISTHRRRKTESRAHGYRHQHCSHCVHCLCFTGCSTQKVPQAKMTHGRFACFEICAVDMVALFLLDRLESTAQMREALAVAHQRPEVQSANVKALGNSYKAQRKMTHEVPRLSVCTRICWQTVIRRRRRVILTS